METPISYQLFAFTFHLSALSYELSHYSFRFVLFWNEYERLLQQSDWEPSCLRSLLQGVGYRVLHGAMFLFRLSYITSLPF